MEARTGTLERIQRNCPSCQDQVRKDEAVIELNLVRDIKGKRKRFSRYIGYKSKTRENISSVLVLGYSMTCFASVFTSKHTSSNAQVVEGKSRIKNCLV